MLGFTIRMDINRVVTGALKGILVVSSGGDDAATLKAVCGVGGVIGPGTVCDDWVEEGV